MAGKKRRLLLALGLFVLSPFVGEFLLGNQPITKIDGVIFLAPIYGGCALLIREFTRRAGRGWPTILLLSAAYGLFLEGIVDQMLFNPGYLGLSSFEGMAAVPVLGTSITIVQASLALHTIWSIAVPIALIESFDKTPRRPWLGKPGMLCISLVIAAAATLLMVYQAQALHFWATWWQFAGTAAIIIALIIAGFAYKPKQRIVPTRTAPRPHIVGMVSFGLTSLYWLSSLFTPEGNGFEWFDVIWWALLAALAIGLGRYWSRSQNWSGRHRLMIAGGALLTYTWAGFVQAQYLEVSHTVAAIGSAVFGTIALLVLWLAIRQRTYSL